jgi:hypothetical protein
MTSDFEPHVSWDDENHLIIEIDYVSLINKSLHVLGDVYVTYRTSENLSEKNFLKQESEAPLPQYVKDGNLKQFKAFQAWAKQNAEMLRF